MPTLVLADPTHLASEKAPEVAEVFLGGQNLRLEAPHLTARGRLFGDGMAADDPPHDRVEAEPVGIVHVVVAAKASENGLAELADHAMPPVHAGTTVGKNIANHLSKFNGGIKLSIVAKSERVEPEAKPPH